MQYYAPDTIKTSYTLLRDKIKLAENYEPHMALASVHPTRKTKFYKPSGFDFKYKYDRDYILLITTVF